MLRQNLTCTNPLGGQESHHLQCCPPFLVCKERFSHFSDSLPATPKVPAPPFSRKLLQRILPKAATRFNFSLHLHIIHHQGFYVLYITYIIYINCIYITYITGNIYTLSSTPHTSPTTSRSLTSPTASTSHLPQNSNKVTQTYVIYTT